MAQQPTFDFPLTAMLSALGMELPALFAIGLILLAISIVLAITFPNPTPHQERVFRGLFGLAAACIASEIPGFLNINSKIVSAGGALAVFVLIYLLNPPKLIQEIKPKPPPATTPSSTVTESFNGLTVVVVFIPPATTTGSTVTESRPADREQHS